MYQHKRSRVESLGLPESSIGKGLQSSSLLVVVEYTNDLPQNEAFRRHRAQLFFVVRVSQG